MQQAEKNNTHKPPSGSARITSGRDAEKEISKETENNNTSIHPSK
jgi:hypothetical protein